MDKAAPPESRFSARAEQSITGQQLRCAAVLAHPHPGGAVSDRIRRRKNHQVSGKLLTHRSLQPFFHPMLVSRPAPSIYAAGTLLGHVRSGCNLVAAIVPFGRAADS